MLRLSSTNLSYGAMPGEFLGLVQAAVRTNQFEEALENLERAREAYSAVGASDMDPVLDEVLFVPLRSYVSGRKCPVLMWPTVLI